MTLAYSLALAVLAGIIYAAFLCTPWGRRLSSQKTHVATVIGVAMTLGFIALVDWEAAQLALLFFVATGISQIVRREVMDLIAWDRIIKRASGKGNDQA